MDWTYIIVSVVSGIVGASFPTLFFFKSNKRKEKAIAENHEITNDKEYITIYKDIINEYQKLLCFNQACKERINT